MGGLELTGSDFGRKKSLLLLTYVRLEDGATRAHLMDLFWSQTTPARRANNLSRTLSDIRRQAPDVVKTEANRVHSRVQIDVNGVYEALTVNDYDRVISLYRGHFLEGFEFGWGLELEEWIDEKRCALANQIERVHLTLAERDASRRRFDLSAQRAAQAYGARVGGSDPELLERYYALFAAADHPFAEHVRDEAGDYRIALTLGEVEAQLSLTPTFIGRERERAWLEQLEAGTWVWLKGGVGSGKSALMQRVCGNYLPAHAETPLAALAPLLIDSCVEEQPETLNRQEEVWLIDSWEVLSPDCRNFVMRLRQRRSRARVVVASPTPPPLDFDYTLELGPLTPEMLAPYELSYEETGGLPHLVHAALQNVPLHNALGTLLDGLPPRARDLYLTLTLIGEATQSNDLGVETARRALCCDAASLTDALDVLTSAGLLGLPGKVRVAETAMTFLKSRPRRFRSLLESLRPHLNPPICRALYERLDLLLPELDDEENEVGTVTHVSEAACVEPSRTRSSTSFVLSWTLTHGLGFLLVALFYVSSLSAFKGTGIFATTLSSSVALLWSGWSFVKAHRSCVDWSGVAVALLIAAGFNLIAGQRLQASESLVFGSGFATILAVGATLGAARGVVAGFFGSAGAALGVLFAASQVVWVERLLRQELTTSAVGFVVALSVGALLWGFLLASLVKRAITP